MFLKTKAAFEKNNLEFQRALDRIAQRYSKCQHDKGAVEVDLENTDIGALGLYMSRSKRRLLTLEAKEDPKSDTEFDDTDVSSSVVMLDDETSTSCSSTSLLNEAEITMKPEDELEMTLNSRHSSLADVYSSAVNHIGQAQRLNCVYQAADSVVRKYRKWRLQGNCSMNTTSNASLGNRRKEPEAANAGHVTSFSAEDGQEMTCGHPHKSNYVQRHFPTQARPSNMAFIGEPSFVMDLSGITHIVSETSAAQLGSDTPSLSESSGYLEVSPLKRGYPATANSGHVTSLSAPRLPHTEDAGQGMARPSPQKSCYVQRHTPKLAKVSIMAPHDKPILVMDLSGITNLPTQTSAAQLGETFTITGMESSVLEPSVHQIASPSRILDPGTEADLSLRSKRLLLAAQQQTNTKHSVYAPVSSWDAGDFDKKYQVRQNLLKARVRHRDTVRISPYSFPKTLNKSPGSFSRSISTSSTQLSHSPRSWDTHFQSNPRSKIRRYLPFDSSMPLESSSSFKKKLDDDFTNVYHKYICLNKSSPYCGIRCQKCVQRAEARRRPSSRAVEALVSPHRVFEKKRYRDLDLESPPLSKRYKGSVYMHSPGSKRHGRELIRRCLYTESPAP